VARTRVNPSQIEPNGSDGQFLKQVGGVVAWATFAGLTDADFIVGETPTGAIDAINLQYVLANVPTTGTVQVYLDGLRLRDGASHDYQIASTSAIVMNYAPETGQNLLVDYRT